MKNLKNYEKLLKMMFIDNYYTDFMFQEAMMMFTFNIVSHYFQFPFSFQVITKVCWNLCLQVLILKYIHKFQQNEWYLENKKEIRNYERQFVDYNVMHTVTCIIMNSMQ